MSNPIEALFGAGVLPKTDFPPESRYHGIAGRDAHRPRRRAGRLSRPPLRAAARALRHAAVHRVAQGERLDRIAAPADRRPRAVLDALRRQRRGLAEELEATGARVRITLPIDVPAPEEDSR